MCGVLRKLIFPMVFMALLGGCSFGPRHLRDGRVAYNEAVRSSSDKELLLNIVRLRYFDTVEFMSINSISAQISFSVALGGVAGTETGSTTSLGVGELAWTNRPTFIFTPQRGGEFAKQIISPVPLPIITNLISAEWDAAILFRLLVQNMNGLKNASGITTKEFLEVVSLLHDLQGRADLYFGSIERSEVVSGPIAASQVSGTDLVEAAKAGFRFSREPEGSGFILTKNESKSVLYIPLDAPERARIFELLRLRLDGNTYVEIRSGTQTEKVTGYTDHIELDTRSVLDAIAYMAGGVEIPASHIEKGLTVTDWLGNGMEFNGLKGLFRVRSSEGKPESYLAVKYRGYWFYLAEDDMQSKGTFLYLAEILRLALSPGVGQNAPVLTLPVGSP